MRKYQFLKHCCFLLLCLTWAHADAQQVVAVRFTLDGPGTILNEYAITSESLVNENFTIDLSGVQRGVHRLYVQVRDEAGQWSHYATRNIQVEGSMNMVNLEKGEYYFDVDPGPGNGYALLFPSESELDENIYIVIPSELVHGVHHLYVRVQDGGGQWSQYVSQNILVEGAMNMVNLEKGEYYFDVDPGPGNGYALLIPVQSAVEEDIYVAIPPQMAHGVHHLFVRVQDEGGQWHHVVRRNILVEGAMGMTLLTNAEYFYDIEPGFGNGYSLLLPSANAVDQDVAFLVPEDLSLGTHQLYVRSQDEGGQWSHYVHLPVEICDLVIPEISASGEICAGDTMLLEVPDAYISYLWNTGDTTSSVTISTAGEYSVYVNDGDCGTTVTTEITFITLPVPEISQVGNMLVCNEAGYGYQWFLNGIPIEGATDQSYDATTDGIYTVEITFETCSEMSGEFTFDFVGIVDPVGQFEIYPVPATDVLWVFVDGGREYSVSVLDETGRECRQWNFSGPQFCIPVVDLAAGNYGLILSSGVSTEYRHVVVIH